MQDRAFRPQLLQIKARSFIWVEGRGPAFGPCRMVVRGERAYVVLRGWREMVVREDTIDAVLRAAQEAQTLTVRWWVLPSIPNDRSGELVRALQQRGFAVHHDLVIFDRTLSYLPALEGLGPGLGIRQTREPKDLEKIQGAGPPDFHASLQRWLAKKTRSCVVLTQDGEPIAWGLVRRRGIRLMGVWLPGGGGTAPHTLRALAVFCMHAASIAQSNTHAMLSATTMDAVQVLRELGCNEVVKYPCLEWSRDG